MTVTSTKLTFFQRVFLEPANSTHRQYEALRAFFVEGFSSAHVAERFGYSPGSFRVLCHQFRKNPRRPFFLPPQKGPHTTPKADRMRGLIITLRKQNLSVTDISRALAKEGNKISSSYVTKILQLEGFAKLPRRRDHERLRTAGPDEADVANVQLLDFTPRTFRTRFGGLFLFMPFLAEIPFDRIMHEVGMPGSKMIPAGHAMRAVLALKLFGIARYSHIMSHVFDDGLALFSGLNASPKRQFLTEYSTRIHPASYPPLMKEWFNAVGKVGLKRGTSFDLDFHTIPYHGDDALVEKHYVSKRSRRQKGILAFLAQDADHRVFCYANANVRKKDQPDEILRFIDFWKSRTGRLPRELVFDSRLTTYRNLDAINKMGTQFITLRRRSPSLLRRLQAAPPSALKTIELRNVGRIYRNPKVLDQKVTLKGYHGLIRQMIITDLGHEDPTILITNQMRRSPADLVDRYAKRMIIENAIADGIDFFHMDALSSAVALNINCDLQLTLIGSSLYRLFAQKLGSQYENAKSRHIFNDFIDATARIHVSAQEIAVHFQRRTHDPFLRAAGFHDMTFPVPWLGGKLMRLVLG
jgi:transposase